MAPDVAADAAPARPESDRGHGAAATPAGRHRGDRVRRRPPSVPRPSDDAGADARPPLPGLPLLLDDEPETTDTAAVPGTIDPTTYRRRVRARLARRLTAGGQRPSGIRPVLEPLVATAPGRATRRPTWRSCSAPTTSPRSAHRGQLRKSGDPYITHPLAVATILAELGMDTTTLVAALLHDTVEDTGVHARGRSQRDFGAEVAHLVDGVTKIDKVKFGDAAQAETIRKMIVAMARDPRVLVIKLADRLHNMRTLRFLPPGEAGAEGPRDAGDPRAAGPPAGHEHDQVGAGGPRLRHPLPEAVRRDRPAGRRAGARPGTPTWPR